MDYLRVLELVEGVVRGKRRVAELVLAALLADGHVLLEDVPGVGKTLLALAVARVLNLKFKRFQFTSDTLPADLLGVFVFDPKKGEFVFKEGPIFTNVLLADEINRASPKTQSALLEAMAERQVTVEGVTFKLPDPFFVIATQNPVDEWGTFPLPHSQLDRFMVKTSVGYPPEEVEREILAGEDPYKKLERLPAYGHRELILRERQKVAQKKVPEGALDFVMRVVSLSRRHPAVRVGISTRGALQWVNFARALAHIRDMPFVPVELLKECAKEVLAHRLVLKESSTQRGEEVVEELLREAS
ncbi:MAG: AAA domain-containing protein [Aquificae bacterium]|nr:AAA domain-containing protein [Aquificota bacterium]